MGGCADAQKRPSISLSLCHKLTRTRSQQLDTVLAAPRLLDLGCGSGKLLERLLHENSIKRIVGLDVSYRVLEVAKDRLRLERLPENQKSRIQLMQGSLTYRDQRLEGFDCATAVEVIEHLDPDRLAAFERVVFEFAKPQTLVITTPNTEYNIKFDNLPAGNLRHKDHRFEWTRLEFESWAAGSSCSYPVRRIEIWNGIRDIVIQRSFQVSVFPAMAAPNRDGVAMEKSCSICPSSEK